MPHPHDDDSQHSRRPEWWNGISLGNVLTILGGMFVLAGLIFASGRVLADKQATDTRQDADIARLQADTRALRAEYGNVNANLVRLMVHEGVQPAAPVSEP